MHTSYKQFRAYAEYWLESNRKTYQELADMANYSIGHITDFMRGRCNSDNVARAIADALDIGILYYNGKCIAVKVKDGEDES